MRSLLFFPLALLLPACTPPDARAPGSYGGGIGDDALRAPQAASAAQTAPDVARCFVDQPRHGWVKLRVHLTPAGAVEKVEDEGSTAEVAAIECAMRAVAAASFAPCTGCGHYEHHVEMEVPSSGEEPTGPPGGGAWYDAGTMAPLPAVPPLMPPPSGGDAGVPGDETWM
jgi:hypothetical protein